jgi:hypothetical protein
VYIYNFLIIYHLFMQTKRILMFVAGMQNLSISCAIVCLIILASSALVGLLGVFKHQISAVLVTAVMYLLAGEFALLRNLCIVSESHVYGT